ncbi:MAG: PQQ-binding-like beta-propeller repeat protein, partial [Phycisphaerales bacterium]|nr:PQQ-binding-like beta-propeller repeat protein [Phycisphaerales bacterium]
ATPTIGIVDGKRIIVTYTGKVLLGIDPKTGETLWKDETIRGDRPLSSATIPVIVSEEGGEKIIVPTHVRGIYCVQVKNGKVETLWMREKSHWFENIAVYDGCIYAPSRDAELDCIDLATGKDLWHSRIGMPEPKEGEPPEKRPGGDRQPLPSGGTLMIADGKILMLNRNGLLICGEISRDGINILSSAKILHDSGWSYHHTPTLSHGRIYMRNIRGQVTCLDVRKP